jgi:2-O-(6-phospho-alpha-D-mannosyl)-D-glycerate hydrolase
MAKRKSQRTARAYYVQGTHWDREWYLPFQEFRARLVAILDRLIEVMERNEDFRTFFLDGQTAIVEDYLAIRPENRERLMALVRSGRLQVGPWYVMPDESLPSGEALVRNLLLGCRQSRQMGVDAMRVGYICDMFGHNSQFPQVLRGFGIDSAVFFRGICDATHRPPFRWVAADGSDVMAIKLSDGGGYGMCTVAVRLRQRETDESLGSEADVDALIQLAEDERRRTGLDSVLLLDALDHYPAEERMIDILARANEKAGDAWQFRWSTLDEFLKQVRPGAARWPAVKGELREPAGAHQNAVLNNVLSSRVRLKQANVRCQTLLESWAEPLAVLAGPLGYDGGRTSIEMAWKYLLLNHPHDSICGCSLDQVHNDMVYRFDQARGLGEIVRRDAAEAVAARTTIDRQDMALVVQVWNPLPVARHEVVDLRLLMPEREDKQREVHDQMRFQSFELLDERGRKISYQKLADGTPEPSVWMAPNGTPCFEERTPVDVAVRLKLPACGYTTLRARWIERPRLSGGTLSPGPGVMENRTLRVDIQPNGTFDLTDKRNGAVYRGIGLLEDMADIGNGWNHFSPTSDEVHSTVASTASVAKVADGREKVVHRITHRVTLPSRFDTEAERRSAETCDIEVTTELTLRRDGTAVECRTRVMNTVRDHSLRVLLPTDLAVDEWLAETPFDVVTRSVTIGDRELSIEPEQDVKPVTSFVGAHDGKRGLFVTTEGLHEAGLRDDERRTLVVTLMRGFPRNWRATVRDQVGGQSLGKLDLRWQIVPVAKAWNPAEMALKARALTAGVYTHLSRRAEPDASLPPSQSLMKLEKGTLTLSALKAADSRPTAVLRVVNLGTRAARDRVRFARKVKRFRECTLEEKPVGKWQKPQQDWIPLSAKAKQLVSIEIDWRDPPSPRRRRTAPA